MREFKRGVKAGLPIGLGYFSVSFTFGIMAITAGLTWWQATVISMLTVTSAGQFAGIGIMIMPGQYIQMLLAQITINMRYAFMSISLSQKCNSKFSRLRRCILGFMMTDEVFAVASQEEEVRTKFFTGLTVLPYIGWASGTLLGALLGNVLPARLMSALSLAIYGMFVAIVTPEMKKSKAVVFTVIIAAVCSCAFRYISILSNVSSGITITVCAIFAATLAAILFPVKEEVVNE